MLRKLSLMIAGGAAGGLCYVLVMWLFGTLGITDLFKVDLAVVFDYELVYTGVGMGAIAGLLFLIPVPTKSWIIRGLTLSVITSAIELFVLFPIEANEGAQGIARVFDGKSGMLGLHLGAMTPFFVVLYNAVWGTVASFWVKITER